MADTLACPQCGRSLKVTDELYGQEVQCPACRATFVAARPVPPALAYTVREQPVHARRGRDEGPADGGRGRPPLAVGQKVQPHRGWTVLGLGILTMGVMCCPVASWLIGGLTLAMASADLRQMAAGAMDRNGQGTTEAGRACAIIGIVVTSIWGAVYLFGVLAG
jgi:hypothetical protein